MSMRQLHTYLIKQQMNAMLMVLFGLLILVWLNHSLKILELVVNKGAAFSAFMLLAFLPLPLWLMVALPLACFIAVLWVIYKFTADRELTVMQAIGLSPVQFTIAPLIFGSFITCFLFLNSIILLPHAFSIFKQKQFEVRSTIPKILIQDKVFVDLGKDLTLYIQEKLSQQKVSGVFIQDSRNPKQIVTYTSQFGEFLIRDGSPIFELRNGQRIALEREANAAATLNFQTHTLDLSQRSNDSSQRFTDANEETILDLLDKEKTQDVRFYSQRLAMAHYRLAAPLQAVSLVLIACAILLIGRVSRANIAKRIGIAACAGIALQALIIPARGLIIETPASWPIIYLVSIIPGMLSFYAISYPQKTSRFFASLFNTRKSSNSVRA